MSEKAHDTAQRVFWCNTNRGGGTGGNSLELRMHERCFVAAWSFSDHPDGTFNYTAHMRRVRSGDMIVMYAMRVGVIGIGRATESRLELLFDDHPDRLRQYLTEGENVEEWRIPVEWLAWDENDACVVEPLNGTFLEITHHPDRVNSVLQHFGL